MAKNSSGLTGVAGEYFVAAELSRRGYLASLTLRNSKGIDILASDEDEKKQIGIQVKCSRRRQPWMLNEKSEKFIADNLFYVFVELNDNQARPDYYIVPSKVVAEYISSNHKLWLGNVGRKGQKHNDTTLRKYADVSGVYRENWDILCLG